MNKATINGRSERPPDGAEALLVDVAAARN
jgi:hypothetical protein